VGLQVERRNGVSPVLVQQRGGEGSDCSGRKPDNAASVDIIFILRVSTSLTMGHIFG
jgi:hypothetical protein